MAFNEKLKELRTGQNLTQKEFAQKIGLSAASVIAYERNEKKPSFDVLLSIAEQFDVSLDWLCRDKTDQEYKVEKWYDLMYLVYSVLKNKYVPVEIRECKESKCDDDAVCLVFAKTLIDPADINPDLQTNHYEVYPTPCYTDFEQMSDIELCAFENPVYKFITSYAKMKDLLNNGSISTSLFNLWLVDEFTRNNNLIWDPHKWDIPEELMGNNDNGND